MIRIQRLVCWVLFSSVLALPAAANEVHEYQLDNGLRILVKVDRRAPIVISQLWYKVGSSYEYDGITGVSHVLEHMMFKGTENLAPGEFSETIARHGGRENAFTGRHYTAYFQRINRDQLELCLRLEAERMRGLKLVEEELAKELEVVKEERFSRTDDKPSARVYERFNATAFVTSPSRNPIIGWLEDLNSLTIEDVRAWYDAWYAPNNATLVVAGDVQPDEVHALAKKHFGPLQPRPVRESKPRTEVEQHGTRRIAMRLPARVPYLVMGYKVPSITTIEDPREAYALELLAAILDAGDSARLTSNLVRGNQVAASTSAGYEIFDRFETLFLFDAVPARGRSTDDVENALMLEIERVKSALVSEAELARVKTQIRAQQVYQRDSLFYQAMQIGTAESVGLGYRAIDDYLEGIAGVTREDIQRAARKYLVDDRLTVGVLEPIDA